GPVTWGQRRPGISLDLHLDGRSLAFSAALCLLTGILFGLAPAFRGSKGSLPPTLGELSTGASGLRGRFGLGNALVVAQVALSLLLLVGAGLFLRTLHNLRAQDLGFDRQHALLVLTMPAQTGRQGAALLNFWQTVQERLSSLPGVVSASAMAGG